MTLDFEQYLKTRRDKVNRYLEDYLDRQSDEDFEYLRKAMRYSLFAGGKRVRPIIAMAACAACGGDEEKTIPVGAALEMIHTFSLIHDDLPSMDDDDLRRSKPTSHKVFGEAHAILAGDALLAEAFRMLADRRLYPRIPAETGLEIMREVAEGTGVRGMVGGQSLDILSEGKPIDPEKLHMTHLCKTARFVACAAVSGALVAEGTPGQIEALRRYGELTGLAFQIVDDCLNAAGDEKTLGKAAGSDARRGKATYPALYGLEKSREKAEALANEAVVALDSFDEKADPVRRIARYIVKRDR